MTPTPPAPHPLRTTLVSIWSWFLLAAGICLVFPFTLLWRVVGWPIDRMNYFGGRLFRYTAVWMVRGTPGWHFEVRGTPPTDPRHPYVVVSNHESFADILLLSHLPWEMKWLSKVELMRIPVLGWTMWAVRDIGVNRGHRGSARQAMAACAKRLSARVSLVIFPEGTRSPTEELLPFKDGAFRLAIDAGVPILPLVITGTRNAIAKHDWRVQPAHAVVEILAPIPSVGKTTQTLKAETRAAIEAARVRVRASLGERA